MAQRRDRGTAVIAVAAGFAVAAVGAGAAFVYGLLAALSCDGTDASPPPAAGSLGDSLCSGPGGVAGAALGVAAVLMPLAGGFLAAWSGRLRPLALGFTLASAAILLLAAAVVGIGGVSPVVALAGPAVAMGAGLFALARAWRR